MLANQNNPNNLKPTTNALLVQAHEWILILEDPTVSPAERQKFQAWLDTSPQHQSIYHQATDFREAVVTLDRAEFDERLHKPSVVERVTGLTDSFAELGTRFKYQTASALVLVLLTVFVMNIDLTSGTAATLVTAEYTTAKGEVRTVVLDDGTAATLGADSHIRWRYGESMRTAELLAGTVFVDVVKDPQRPFRIKVGNTSGTAIGTAFDMRRFGSASRIGVAHGIVEVAHPYSFAGISLWFKDRKQLVAGEEIAASQDDGLSTVLSVKPDMVGAWREHRLVYAGATLAEVVMDANRYSNKMIRLDPTSPEIAGLLVRGVFLGSDIERLLSGIALIHSLDIDQSSPDVIVLRNQP